MVLPFYLAKQWKSAILIPEIKIFRESVFPREMLQANTMVFWLVLYCTPDGPHITNPTHDGNTT